ncbi:hypothetical protein M0R45_021037 [Rubus argutus]|uniref:PPM-type phosphatase domain-containing protein n=1 Tax=Rubus argutus TaxID=59490 RepID=A0AAW1XC18_RUBAR
MVLFPSFLDGLGRTISIKKTKNCHNDVGKETADALAKEAKKNELVLSSSGIVKSDKSNNFSSVCSKRGQKGINQDCLVIWEEFGCQEDMIFCGVFDGHDNGATYIDRELKHSPKIDSYRSGTTALTIVKQGELLIIAHVGDSRAVWPPLQKMAVWYLSSLQSTSSLIYLRRLRESEGSMEECFVYTMNRELIGCGCRMARHQDWQYQEPWVTIV